MADDGSGAAGRGPLPLAGQLRLALGDDEFARRRIEGHALPLTAMADAALDPRTAGGVG